MPEIAIATEGLTRRFGALTAVDGINLQVESGQFFWVPGPEWRGKIHHHKNADWFAGTDIGADGAAGN